MIDDTDSTTTPELPAVQDAGEIVGTNDGGGPKSTWHIPSDAMMANTAHYEQAERELLRAFYVYATDARTGLTLAKAAELVGVDRTVLHRVYSGKYRNGGDKLIVPVKLIDGIRKVLTAEEQRREEGKVPFVLTKTARNIWAAADLCLARSRIGMVWGKSQTGKTTALKEFRKAKPLGQVRYICAEPSSGTHELVRQLAREVGIGSHGAHDTMKHRLLKAIDSHTLLIVDEVHQFAFTYRTRSKLSCLELLRWIHDQTGCGMLLCGTNVWRDDLTAGKDKEYLEQLARRGAVKLQLPDAPTTEDLNAIYKAFGLDAPKGQPAETMKYLAKANGLTVVTETLAFGQRQARKAGRETLGWDDVMEAHEILHALETGEACK